MTELRKRFFVNGKVSKAEREHGFYWREAVNLLEYLRYQKTLANVPALRKTFTTQDGARITAVSSLGFEEVWIDVPHLPVVAAPQPMLRRVSEYCVWGPDLAVYSSAYTYNSTAAGISQPLMSSSGLVYLPSQTGSTTTMYVLDSADLSEVGSLGSGWDYNNVGLSAVDVESDRFFLAAYDNIVTGASFMLQWGEADTSVTRFNASAAYNSGIHMHFTNFLASQYATNGLTVLMHGDYDGNNYWSGIDTATNTREWMLMNPPFGEHNYNAISSHVGSDGGTVFVHNPKYNDRVNYGDEPRIYQYDSSGSLRDSYEFPFTPPEYGDLTVNFAALENDGETVWLSMTTNTTTFTHSIYKRERGVWSEVQMPFGVPAQAAFVPGILHDPVTDAIAVAVQTAHGSTSKPTGVCIFNAADCMGVQLDPFYYEFPEPPSSTDAYCTQFHNGSILVHFILTGGGGQSKVGKFTIGRLKQRKVTDSYENDALVSSITE